MSSIIAIMKRHSKRKRDMIESQYKRGILESVSIYSLHLMIPY